MVTPSRAGSFFDPSSRTYNNLSGNQINQDFTEDNKPPTVRIDNVTVQEGDVGPHPATFTVSLSKISMHNVTVDYSTAPDDATAGSDYASTSGTLIIPAGVLTRSINVSVLGDLIDEVNEHFFLRLSNPNGAKLGDAQGRGTIEDDDDPPALSIDDVTVTETDSGTTIVTFGVKPSGTSGKTITVHYQTLAGEAKADSDYIANSGTLTISAGSTGEGIAIAIVGDKKLEPTEHFTVKLSGPIHATIADGIGQATIFDTDPVFSLFEANAVGHSWANAYLLSLASHYVYTAEGQSESDWQTAFETRFTDLGLHFEPNGASFISEPLTNTQVVMMDTDDALIVVFRGTEPLSIQDWLTDADLVLVPVAPGINIHEGFLLATNSVYGPVKNRILVALAQNKKIWLTGHSLGGALATITAAQLWLQGIPVQGVYTYGSPRVGDLGFSLAYNAAYSLRPTQRWVDHDDAIPLLVPTPPYFHVGQTNNIVPKNSCSLPPGEPGCFKIRLDDGERPAVGNFTDHDTKLYSSRIRNHVLPIQTLRDLLPAPPE